MITEARKDDDYLLLEFVALYVMVPILIVFNVLPKNPNCPEMIKKKN